MSTSNENGVNNMGPLNLSTTENGAPGAENVFFEMMDPNRASTSDMCEIPAQLEEILKNVYDINTNDFNPALDSTRTATDSGVFEASIGSTSNSFPINFSSDSHSLYITPNENNSTASSVYFTPNTLASNTNYQTNPSFIYNRPDNREHFTELMLDQKTYNASIPTNVPEEDNDSSPVYLNFNIQNMTQSAQTFSTEFEKYTHQANSTPLVEKKNNEINYIEYMNNIEEAWHPQFVEVNTQRDQIFRQIPTNIMQTTLKKIPVHKIYSFPQEIEKLNGAYGVEIMSQFQSLNNNAILANYTEAAQHPSENVERQIISRNPLQTRLSIKIDNSEWAVINDKSSHINNQATDGIDADSELLAIDQTDPDIPFIKGRPSGRKRRKQSLTPLEGNDISFMNNKGEFSKFEETDDLPTKEIKFPTETPFVTFRKKPKPIANDSLVESSSSAGRSSGFSTQTTRESIVNLSSNSSAILVSSDSDSDDGLESSDPKCLKCNNCKKMFKTARSYSIHKKRCEVPSNSDSAYVIEVEYLESEKEDECDALTDGESKNIKYTDESVEMIESNSIESLEISKQEIVEDSEQNDGSVVRRNTRSSSLKNNSTQSLSLPTPGSPGTNSLKKVRKTEEKQIMPICDVCGKSFRQRSYLIAHKRIHEKNFKCQFCFKTFVIKTAYDTHVLEKCDKIPAVKLKRLRSTVANTNSK